jgi:hypothetical protein
MAAKIISMDLNFPPKKHDISRRTIAENNEKCEKHAKWRFLFLKKLAEN